MNRLSKFVIAGLAVAAMTGTAVAQDAPADPPAGDGTGDGSMPAPTGDPAATDPAMEPAPAAGKSIGADVVAVLPLGDYADIASFAIGALGRFEYGVKPNIAITVRAGLIYNIAKELGGVTPTILMIPAHVGGKYMIGTSGLFGQAELGITHTRFSAESGGVSVDDSRTKFSFEVGAGYQKGKISARAGLWYIADDDALMAIMASVGYDFAAL
jgi:hypothetical protein